MSAIGLAVSILFGTYCTLSPGVLKHAAVCHNTMTQRKTLHSDKTLRFGLCMQRIIVHTARLFSLVKCAVQCVETTSLKWWNCRTKRRAETRAAERSCGDGLSLQTTLLSGADYLKLCFVSHLSDHGRPIGV